MRSLNCLVVNELNDRKVDRGDTKTSNVFVVTDYALRSQQFLNCDGDAMWGLN